MLENYTVDITEFIKITNGGIKVADFVQVRDALISRYKDVYGEDIDLSTASADGVYVNNLALIINNILQSYKTLYANLDVKTASGVYLDNLCALSNITRKPATYSTASLTVTNEDTQSAYSGSNITFVDKAGTEWIYEGDLALAVNGSNGDTQSIIVKCKEIGPVKAPAGWIDQTLEATSLSVVQENAAILGEDEETDADLRARRAQSTGADGTTVLDSLVGALLEISGIKDVKIYNNNTGSDSTSLSKDGAKVLAHSIYAILRYSEGVDIEDSLIGSLIYEKLTPGILTSPASDGTNPLAGAKSFNYIPSLIGQALTNLDSDVYWKQAQSLNPKITVTLNTYEYFNVSEVQAIGEALINYLNKLSLSTDLTVQNLTVETAYADPLFLSRPTYVIDSIAITGAVSGTYTNPDGYYKYSTISEPVISTGTCTFELT